LEQEGEYVRMNRSWGGECLERQRVWSAPGYRWRAGDAVVIRSHKTGRSFTNVKREPGRKLGGASESR